MKFAELFKNDDGNKYIFEWDGDIGWDDDGKVTIPKTEYCAKPTDEQAEQYMTAINNAFESAGIPQKIVSVSTLNGPGGGWPVAVSRTSKPMTLKEFINFYNEYVCDEPMDEITDEITIVE